MFTQFIQQRNITLTLLIILSLVFSFVVIGGENDITSQLSQAQTFYNSARFDDAIDVLNQLAVLTTVSAKQRIDVYKLMGFALVAKGYYDKAKEAVEKILELDPNIQFDPDYVPPRVMNIYYAVWKEKRGNYQIEQQRDPGLQTMAVLDFDNNSIGADKAIWEAMGKGLAQMLITDLSKVVKLQVIERERINYILSELKLEQGENFDRKTAVRIGQQLGVHTMLFGGFSKIGKNMRLDARLIKVETGELIKAEEITGKADDFIDLEKELALKIAKNLDVELSKYDLKNIKQSNNQSLEAALAYSEGLSLLDKEDYKSALKKFLKALEYNPNYIAAQKKVDLIKHLAS